jgi:hypothetical protein
MIDMIDHALLNKARYDEWNTLPHESSEQNPWIKFKNADSYLGWREMCVWFTGLFDVLNSTTNRLDTGEYSHNLQYLKDFHEWFSEWKTESLSRRLSDKSLPDNPTAYQSMQCFFTGEASEDCLTMIEGIVGLTEYYCRKGIENNHFVFFLPRRISQDLVENGFSRIRLAIGHGRLDHRTTSAAITKVNMVKEIKSSERSSKKRNASGQLVINDVTDLDEHCTEYAPNLLSKAIKTQSTIIDENCPYVWRLENGIEVLSFNYC